jgi:hypothetical protein
VLIVKIGRGNKNLLAMKFHLAKERERELTYSAPLIRQTSMMSRRINDAIIIIVHAIKPSKAFDK